MNDDAFFVQTMQQLVELVTKGDEYSLLKAAGIIRQLFLDGPGSLVDRLNRDFRHKFDFLVRIYPDMPGPKAVLKYMSPAPPPNWSATPVKRDKFFRPAVH